MSHSPNSPNYERVLAEHRALKDLLAKIDRALAEKTASIDAVSDLIAGLGDRLVRHFSMEEDGGYFAEALTRAPRLVSLANELMAQHPKMCTRARDLVLDVGQMKPKQDWWDATRERFDAFRDELLKHEQQEDVLIQEAYNRDIGETD
ncbi:MAG: hemerythrin domain-containing protein [Rhodopirellula sp.]|mgnify:CR=1 FL=1|nr:hemerythrin domain-containing protein [Rhodopirellula sp.]